ncbi:potassium channel family protein [Fusobacterium sp. MFO224]|uniref:potassium channel family protein n=1 Tax=Fusobacterium sp. MFO224 TaxID=3378070 RepID=UPI0038525786
MEKKKFTFKEFLEKREEIAEQEKEIIIKELDNKNRLYTIINNEKELSDKFKIKEKNGIIINFEVHNLYFNKIKTIENIIFLKKIDLNPDNGVELNREIFILSCYFLEKVEFNFYNGKVNIFNCIFFEEVQFSFSELQSLGIIKSNFKKKLNINESHIFKMGINSLETPEFEFKGNEIDSDVLMEDLEILKQINFKNNCFKNRLRLINLIGFKGSCFKFGNIISEIFILKCLGFDMVVFNDIFIDKKSKIDIEELSNKKYKILEIFDSEVFNLKNIKENIKSLDDRNVGIYDKETFRGLLNKKRVNLKKTIENIKSLLWIPEIKENTELYLALTYLQKKYETKLLWKKVKEDKEVKDLLNLTGIKLLEISTKYFTCWKRCLLSILLINICFAFLFFLMKYDVNQWGKLFECLYFSVITFSTVGYGDISPGTNLLKLLSAFEGLLGIFFTSAFVICLTRKYVK